MWCIKQNINFEVNSDRLLIQLNERLTMATKNGIETNLSTWCGLHSRLHSVLRMLLSEFVQKDATVKMISSSCQQTERDTSRAGWEFTRTNPDDSPGTLLSRLSGDVIQPNEALLTEKVVERPNACLCALDP